MFSSFSGVYDSSITLVASSFYADAIVLRRTSCFVQDMVKGGDMLEETG